MGPLIYSRVVGFLARASQALLAAADVDRTLAPARVQVYVDDPAVTAQGRREQMVKSFDLLLFLWLVLGVPLAWPKGQLTNGRAGYTWIGVNFKIIGKGVVRLTLPAPFLVEFLQLLELFCRGRGTASWTQAKALAGKASRVAYIAPEARPFAGAIHSAKAAAERADRAGLREAAPGRVACRRFAPGARWLRAMVKGGRDARLVPLQRLVFAVEPRADVHVRRVQFDASPWGGGAILYVLDTPTEYFSTVWTPADARHLG